MYLQVFFGVIFRFIEFMGVLFSRYVLRWLLFSGLLAFYVLLKSQQPLEDGDMYCSTMGIILYKGISVSLDTLSEFCQLTGIMGFYKTFINGQ